MEEIPPDVQQQVFAPLCLDQMMQRSPENEDDQPMERPAQAHVSNFGQIPFSQTYQQQQQSVSQQPQHQGFGPRMEPLQLGPIYNEYLTLKAQQAAQKEMIVKKRLKGEQIADDMKKRHKNVMKFRDEFFVLKQTKSKVPLTDVLLKKGYLAFRRKEKGQMHTPDSEGKEFVDFINGEREGDVKTKFTTTPKRPAELFFS